MVWFSSSRDVRVVLHVGNRRFYFSRGGMVWFLERCQARITCGESQILLLSRWYGFDPREVSGSYYMRGIADFTSLEVRLDGMV